MEMPDVSLCPFCRKDSAVSIVSPVQIPLYRCKCGLIFQYPLPAEDELALLYSSGYYDSWGNIAEEENVVRSMKRATFRSALAALPAETQIGRVLDVGCAAGYFLEEAQELGWEPWGVELSSYAAGIAGRLFGNTVRQGTLEQAGFPDRYFHLITMFDLLEHVPEPLKMLKEAGRILTDGGLILIVTPDVGSLSARVMGHRWSHYKREHLWYFTRKRLESLLADSGFYPVVCQSAVKMLTISYIGRQFDTYKHPLLTPLSRLLLNLLPATLRSCPFPSHCGELLMLVRKQ